MLHIALSDEADGPPVAEPSSHLRPAGSTSFASRTATVAVCLAAVLAVVATVGALVLHSLNTGSPAVTPIPATTPMPAPVVGYTAAAQDPNFSATVATLKRVVQTAPIPTDAHPTATPLPGLAAVLLGPLGPRPYRVFATLWWTSSEPQSAIVAYVTAHAPSSADGMARGIGGSGSSLGFTLPATATSGPTTLDIEVRSTADGSAIKVEADTNWLPSTLPAGYIPPGTDQLHVTISRAGHAPTVTKTLTGDAVERIAAVVKGLPTLPLGGNYSQCPNGAGMTDEINFTTGAHSTVIVVNIGSCLQTIATYDGKEAQEFDTGSILDKALLTELGLPASYGF